MTMSYTDSDHTSQQIQISVSISVPKPLHVTLQQKNKTKKFRIYVGKITVNEKAKISCCCSLHRNLVNRAILHYQILLDTS